MHHGSPAAAGCTGADCTGHTAHHSGRPDPRHLDEWNAEMKTYLSKDWSQNTFVNTANSVWMNKDTSWSADIEKDFLTPAKDYYSGEVYEADFNGQPNLGDFYPRPPRGGRRCRVRRKRENR